ncbi:MAG: tetratricopeptide repeat protein [Acidobacteria bacterium]|nr:tetratricopeptide repeat protein [Acidobacteriota bacterium]MBI3657488.1 tetratricopeptide repeat protein [Acidobacteriota bacterium]
MTAKRLTRKELVKEDPFRVALRETADAIIASKVTIVTAFIVVASLAGLFALWQTLSTKSEGESQYMLSKGLDTFHAAVGDPNETALTQKQQALSPPPEFKNDTDKFNEALKRFQETAAKYPNKQAGIMAKYYIGLCQQKLNNPEESIKTLESIRGSFKEPTYVSMVKLTLAELYEGKGQHEAAAKLCQELLDDKSGTTPMDAVLLLLGQCYEGMSKKDEAIKTYTRIGQERANSVYFSDANTRIMKLGGKPLTPPRPPGMPGMSGMEGMPFNME